MSNQVINEKIKEHDSLEEYKDNIAGYYNCPDTMLNGMWIENVEKCTRSL